jgi:hypothetical protein
VKRSQTTVVEVFALVFEALGLGVSFVAIKLVTKMNDFRYPASRRRTVCNWQRRRDLKSAGAEKRALNATFSLQHKERLVAFCDYAIKPYIPRIWRYFLDFLAFEGHANELWSEPVRTMSQVRKTSIVVSASHPDSIALAVENDGRRNDNMKLSRVNQEAPRRFPDTESVLLEF